MERLIGIKVLEIGAFDGCLGLLEKFYLSNDFSGEAGSNGLESAG
jgi:hypothetical protein